MGGSYLTQDLPGTGGAIKSTPADFQVEEIPLYQPCGNGEHLYLFIEKQGVTTFDLLKELARATGLKERDIGYAGLKDACGITRQWLSLPACVDMPKIEPRNISVLKRSRHRNKLRLGHLQGNRFLVRIRETGAEALSRAGAILAELEKKGVPNCFGSQRFGLMGNSHHIGRAIIKGDFGAAAREIIGRPEAIRDPAWRNGALRFRQGDCPGALAELPRRLREERRLVEKIQRGAPARKAVLEMPRRLLRLYLSAFQSDIFDTIVENRLPDLGLLRDGDLAVKHMNGAFFLVEDAGKEQPRANALEISPSGPLFGYKSNLAQGRTAEMETALLQRENLKLDDFRLGGGLKMEGGRRPLRVPLTEVGVAEEGADLIITFVLPAGSYATNVTAEIMKNRHQASAETGAI
jgi:tRNA pseudouridine13 synthase